MLKINDIRGIKEVEVLELEKGYTLKVNRQKNDVNGNPIYKIQLFKNNISVIQLVKHLTHRNYIKKGYATLQSFSLLDDLNRILKYIDDRDNLAQEFKNALIDGKVYLTTNNTAQSQFNVYMNDRKITDIGVYWSNNKNCFTCNAYGTSRTLEIILSIGYNLGLQFNEMKQNFSLR